MKVAITNVTPLMASEFLEKNKSNRKINKNQLDMIVRSIEDNKWRLTHQGVAFYEDGELADGQHRLHAILKTGVTLKMPVFTGIKKDSETVLAIDCGKGRTVVDSASISGFEIKPSDLSVAKGLEFGYIGKHSKKLSHSESCHICSKYSVYLDIINKIFPKNVPYITIAPVKVALANALRDGVPTTLATQFCKTLASGEYNDSLFVNAVKLRAKLLTKNYNGAVDRPLAYNMMYNTLIKTNKGEKVQRITESKLIK